jgi:hypothetical protein
MVQHDRRTNGGATSEASGGAAAVTLLRRAGSRETSQRTRLVRPLEGSEPDAAVTPEQQRAIGVLVEAGLLPPHLRIVAQAGGDAAA